MKAKHELKIDQEYFEAVKDGRKKFEIRKNDRDYKVGDILVLLEYDKYYEAFTGEKITVEITYLTGYAQQNDYVVLGIEEIWEGEELTEIKKVVIPKFVHDFISDAIGSNPTPWKKTDMIRNIDICLDKSKCQKLVEWSNLLGNFITLIEAILYGYEVEKEKLYYVELPVSIWNEHLGELETKYGYLKYDITSDETNIAVCDPWNLRNFKSKLTEETIKSIDERYWAFAVEVEGEE